MRTTMIRFSAFESLVDQPVVVVETDSPDVGAAPEFNRRNGIGAFRFEILKEVPGFGFRAVLELPVLSSRGRSDLDRPLFQALRFRRFWPFSASSSSRDMLLPGSLRLRSDMIRSASSSVMKSGSFSVRRSAGVNEATSSRISFALGVPGLARVFIDSILKRNACPALAFDRRH